MYGINLPLILVKVVPFLDMYATAVEKIVWCGGKDDLA